LDKAEKVLDAVFPSRDETVAFLHPGNRTFDFPSPGDNGVAGVNPAAFACEIIRAVAPGV
jgi:hypothetical protein